MCDSCIWSVLRLSNWDINKLSSKLLLETKFVFYCFLCFACVCVGRELGGLMGVFFCCFFFCLFVALTACTLSIIVQIWEHISCQVSGLLFEICVWVRNTNFQISHLSLQINLIALNISLGTDYVSKLTCRPSACACYRRWLFSHESVTNTRYSMFWCELYVTPFSKTSSFLRQRPHWFSHSCPRPRGSKRSQIAIELFSPLEVVVLAI